MPSPPDLAIEATGLVKTFGAVRPVDGVDLAVPAGSVYAVLGPNGAGKTTTIRMLATLLRPDAGTARVCGHDVVRDPGAVRARISLTGQYASLDEDLTGQENLTLLARLRGYPRAAAAARASELLDAFTLAESASRQVKNYSGGLRRRLDIAASLIITPDALLMKAPAAVLGVTQAVLYPLAFFSNIFIEPSTLPGWLEAFVHVNPVTHLVTATRALMDGIATPGHIGYVLEASAILTAVFAPVSLGLYRAT